MSIGDSPQNNFFVFDADYECRYLLGEKESAFFRAGLLSGMERNLQSSSAGMMEMNSHRILDDFRRRILHGLLPAYCDDPRRSYSMSGFKETSIMATPPDAEDFIWALDNGLLSDAGGGRYRMPRSHADVVIFWEGRKTLSPRPITLSMEPVITIATMARLSRDYGWPKFSLGMESQEWQFDFVAYCPAEREGEYIAGEVKKSRRELNALVESLRSFCREPLGESRQEAQAINARKKWEGLRRSQAPIFWAVGPGNTGQVFEVQYHSGIPIALYEIPAGRLTYPGYRPA